MKLLTGSIRSLVLMSNLTRQKEFISNGPLFGHLHDVDLMKWIPAANEISNYLGIDLLNCSENERRRIFHHYLPLYHWIFQDCKRERCEIIGLSAPQGSGKTTLSNCLSHLFKRAGVTTVSISLDDFYLTGVEQDALSKKFRSNHMLQNRGNAGTHDIPLLLETVEKLRTAQEGERLLIPKYNKSLRNGRGDREDIDRWTEVFGRVDLVLLEGWMLGFRPLPAASSVLSLHPALQEINYFMSLYQSINQLVDRWIVVKVSDIEWVRKWRREAENKMIESGLEGMTDDLLERFVNTFMPAYEAFLPSLYEDGPPRKNDEVPPFIPVEVDSTRLPI